MAQMIMILFICIVIPLFMALFMLGKHSRLTCLFFLIGIFSCLFSAYFNGFLESLLGFDRFYMTYTITPVVEELIKAFPLILYCFMYEPKDHSLLEASIMIGVGFAVLENAYILASDAMSVTLTWALIRGMGAGMMHGVCTLMIGFGLTYVHIRKKLALTGTCGLLMLAMMYHASYNLMIQSDYRFYGIVMPILTFGPIILIWRRRKKRFPKAASGGEKR